jgi:predicted transcriptional regulator
LNSIQRDILQCAADPAHQYVCVSLTHEGTMRAVAGLVYSGYLTLRDSDGKVASYIITAKGVRALRAE